MNNEIKDVPYFIHEGVMARMERMNRRFWILCIIMFLALIATNAGWIYFESQWEDVVTTESYEAEADDGGVAISNGSGRVNYGEGKIHENDEEP